MERNESTTTLFLFCFVSLRNDVRNTPTTGRVWLTIQTVGRRELRRTPRYLVRLGFFFLLVISRQLRFSVRWQQWNTNETLGDQMFQKPLAEKNDASGRGETAACPRSPDAPIDLARTEFAPYRNVAPLRIYRPPNRNGAFSLILPARHRGSLTGDDVFFNIFLALRWHHCVRALIARIGRCRCRNCVVLHPRTQGCENANFALVWS